ncbi:MFS transporter [Streptomyces sp. NPDC060194]|uniref:MFS transporter n=1 Tax=Streptomyces sp. NPDC060194 TaxID=3347069 RepID=UPI00364A10C3
MRAEVRSDAPAAIPAQRAGEGPRPGRWARARHPATVVTAIAALAHLVWLFTVSSSGGDLAAQDAWAEFVGRHPDSAYNLAWYGGMHPVSYSVLSPYLMSVLGVRTTMMAAGTVAAGLLTLVLTRTRATPYVYPAALTGVFALMCNAASGRVTFALGTMFGLAAVACVFCPPHGWLRRGKAVAAAVCAALATAASPVAGLFVGLVAAALFLSRRRPAAFALGLAPVVVVVVSSWLFPFSGTQPMGFVSALLPVLASAAVFLLCPCEWRTVRLTAAIYAAAVLVCAAVDSQIGSNITRLAMLFTGTVLVAALPPRPWPLLSRATALLLACAAFVGWIGYKSVEDVVQMRPVAAWNRELAPLIARLESAGADRGRVEVVPPSSHRDASALSPYVNLARGWNRQADMERHTLFYDGTLNAATYHDWLRRWAVHYVVLPEGRPDEDGGGVREAELLLQGQPYLREIWSDPHWTLYAVRNPVPLADPPATVDHAGDGQLTVRLREPGRALVRVPYTPWLGLVDATGRSLEAPRRDDDTGEYVNTSGCLMPAEKDETGDEWTVLVAPHAGIYRLAAPYQLPRGTGCPEELR